MSGSLSVYSFTGVECDRTLVSQVVLPDGRRLKFHMDETAGNPRTEMDNLWSFAFYSDALSGDREVLRDYPNAEAFQGFLWENRRKLLAVPVYAYIHSGIALSLEPFGDPWDSGQIGWAYVEKERLLKEYGVSRVTRRIRDRVMEVLRGELAEYEAYANGEVYGFVLESPGGEVLDACWGFYGSDLSENGILYYLPKDVADFLKGQAT